jgi:YggT family protein
MPAVVLGNFVAALAMTLDWLLSAYFLVVLVAALVTWVSPDPRNPIVRFLYAVTEPVLAWIRQRLPFVCAGGIDFSPLVLLVVIRFAQWVLVRSLFEFAVQLGAR